MSDFEEPDWLLNFQQPSHPTTLSSDSDSPTNSVIPDVQRDSNSADPLLDEIDTEKNNDTKTKSGPRKSPRKRTPQKRQKVEGASSKKSITNYFKKVSDNEDKEKSDEELEDVKTASHAPNSSVVMLLSDDSESDVAIIGDVKDEERSVPEFEEKKVSSEDIVDCKDSVSKPASKGKSIKKTPSKKDAAQVEIKSVKEDPGIKDELADAVATGKTTEKHVDHRASSSTLPLMLPEKVQRCRALVECEGDSIDMSGDVGAVGRVIMKDDDMLLDLKGTIYKTSIVPCRTFAVVAVGTTEAKIEAIMTDFIQLTPQSNVYDAETLVEGTLEGFSFDSGDEEDKMPKPDHQEGDPEEKQGDGKAKGKGKAKAGKKEVGTPKKRKATRLKPQSKKRKTQPAKKRKR